MLNEKRLAMIRRLGRKDSKYKDFLRSLSWIELQEHSKQREYAAGPWIDGPPPKDGKDYLAQIEKHKRTFLVVWWNGLGWGCNASWCLLEDPIKHAVINLPKEN